MDQNSQLQLFIIIFIIISHAKRCI